MKGDEGKESKGVVAGKNEKKKRETFSNFLTKLSDKTF